MDDRNGGGSHSAKLGALVRKAAAGARQRGEVSLRGVRRSVAEAGDRLKSSQASRQMGSAVDSWRVIKKAADAQRRGNHGLAYRLLEPKVRENPSDVRLVVALWGAALACDRAEDVGSFMIGIIRRLASSGKPNRAAELWMELRGAVPSARVDPSALVRIAETLEAGGQRELLVQALRDAAGSDSKGLSPGLAVRIAEMARELDPPTALRAVHRALEAPGLHQAKRTRLEQLEGELVAAGADDRAGSPAPATSSELPPAPGSVADQRPGSEASAPELPRHASRATHERSARSADGEPGHEPSSGVDWMEAAAEEALQATDPISRFSDLKLREAMPTELLPEAIALQLPGGRTARIEYSRIDAVAVAEVMGLARYPVVLIDLLLNWSSEQDPTLRAVRLRSDAFDPRMVFEAPDDRAEAFRGFVSELLDRCDALALPSPDGTGAVEMETFESQEAYARVVLQVESERGPPRTRYEAHALRLVRAVRLRPPNPGRRLPSRERGLATADTGEPAIRRCRSFPLTPSAGARAVGPIPGIRSCRDHPDGRKAAPARSSGCRMSPQVAAWWIAC